MGWFNKEKAGLFKSSDKKLKLPDGMWIKCQGCSATLLASDVEENLDVCPKCGHHYRIAVRKRLGALLDDSSWTEYDAGMTSVDFLEFRDSKSYRERIDAAVAKGGQTRDAVVCVEGAIGGTSVQIAIFDFSFMGGSMGSVVGEKITRSIERGIKKHQPVIIFSASGGARMQESILSLMQMAKTSAALAKLKEKGLPYISILTDPTTGGVTASFAMLGDLNIAEPKALIGFAGPRVIEQTIRQKLPSGFQRAEYLLEHGMVDVIVPRNEMREKLTSILKIIHQPAA
ncbi:MAG TPA: acetyl-CoA carboxylase, carboxyltransferase subunit beta [Deltaproteobacteria bacterium]|nr:acetyl-CoA carboxylase, carboxyltransferase subunit beta [Deltaproteobacteria bacterium]HQB38615.1 acetyl-CoA carboxylase, carboxyltransferase subunit beta [Deltaproteobacteria bacterium]